MSNSSYNNIIIRSATYTGQQAVTNQRAQRSANRQSQRDPNSTIHSTINNQRKKSLTPILASTMGCLVSQVWNVKSLICQNQQELVPCYTSGVTLMAIVIICLIPELLCLYAKWISRSNNECVDGMHLRTSLVSLKSSLYGCMLNSVQTTTIKKMGEFMSQGKKGEFLLLFSVV